MASTTTPLSGTIKISDLDKSITRNWVGNNLQTLNNLEVSDFGDGNPLNGPIGFGFCYGSPGQSSPNIMSDYYGILGWVDYTTTAINLNFNPNGTIRTEIYSANGSNGVGPQALNLVEPAQIPNGSVTFDGAHWETMFFTVDVIDMQAPFNVFLDGNYIDTIVSDGYYVYDNGGLGYTNGPGPTVHIHYIK